MAEDKTPPAEPADAERESVKDVSEALRERLGEPKKVRVQLADNTAKGRKSG
ncbi:hypothetical protein J2W22_001247 [Sphingomonas kyeonggiensis]|uniref:hypothetical protein n=1 Tax=Sphingomonas kyeonggiensis TaxID=1268553 RepID=UPI0027807541|nr:hypothetical protein [Sphingomonas kyeonggiensis]MDQ0249200.1 hypothetical protein [Sphingomonas kyeonggiensis]